VSPSHTLSLRYQEYRENLKSKSFSVTGGVSRCNAPLLISETGGGAPVVVMGAPVTVTGAPVIVMGAPVIVMGAPVIVIGAPVVVMGAPVIAMPRY